jgi:hypothetical protein
LGSDGFGRRYGTYAFCGTAHGFANHVEGEDENADEDDDKEDENQSYAGKKRVDEEINEVKLRHYSGIDW